MAHVISDAGPLIALAKADSLFVPRDLFSRIRIPEAVWLECVQKTGADSRRIEHAASERWLNVVSVATKRSHPPSLGIGEAEAIQLALETEKALLIMDDRLARREATRRGLGYIGTVRMLHLAEQRSIVDNAEATIQRMAECGYGLLRKVGHRLKEQQLKNARSRISAGDYEIVELNSVEQLVSEGRKLGLCVGHKDQLGREYHRRLRREESEFWSIRRRAKAKGLVEIDKKTRCVVEVAGRRNGTLKLKRKVACGVLRELDATADSEDTFSRVGAFGAILDSRPKDTAPIEFDGYEYRVWLEPVSKQVVIEERWSAKADDDRKGSRRWSLFERHEPVLHPRRRRRGAPLGASFSGVAGGMFASRRDGYWRVHALAASLPCHRRADSRGALTTYESRKPVAINSRYAHSQQRSGIARTEDIGLRSACRTQPERRRAGPTLPSMQGRPGYFEKADENTTACSFPWPLDRARAHQTVEHQSTGKPAHALQNRLQRHEPKDDCRDPPVRDTSDRRVGRRGWVDLPPVDHALVKACTPPAGSARSRVGLQSPHWGHRRDAGRHCARA